MPIGAVVSSRNNMMLFADNPILGHITTFGGHPVVAAAANAGIKELVRTELILLVSKKEQLFRELLCHKAIKGISGKGLMLAIELDTFENNLLVIQKCLSRGLVTDWFLFANNRIRIAAPLTISEGEIREACEIITQAIDEVYV